MTQSSCFNCSSTMPLESTSLQKWRNSEIDSSVAKSDALVMKNHMPALILIYVIWNLGKLLYGGMKDSFSEAENFIEIAIQKQKEQLFAELNRIDVQMMRSVTRVQKSEMAYELHGFLAGNVSIVTGENIKPSYVGDDEAFLRKVSRLLLSRLANA
ncbi:unnamed protein product [Eruca vesicaria subsp. sativa]|uniref:Uncharacterized protein n=1 Tax=Eruca vesicaria subsp. sativa TaxID=29727 RepID=A0ABC8LJP9_ERUVS|nr:unnamed protein product [Eruca vesicaria subsp. sativa]